MNKRSRLETLRLAKDVKQKAIIEALWRDPIVLSGMAPLYKTTTSSFGIRINGTQFETNEANELQIKAGVLAPAAHTHVIGDVTGLPGALDLKAGLNSPALTGSPTVPTPDAVDNSTRIANTAFVRTVVAALVDSSPESLDTLNELATALGDDPNFATTMVNALAAKAPIDSPVFTGTVGGINKLMVGLGNVDNTSDANKPVSTAQQTALNLKVDKEAGKSLVNDTDIAKLAAFNVTSGKVTIDRDLEVTGNITASKDVIAWVSGAVTSDVLSSLSAVGPLYKPTASSVGIKTNATQFEVNASNELQIKAGVLAPASHTHVISEVSGLQGALDLKATVASLTAHTGNTANPHGVTKLQVGLGSVDNTSDIDKPVSTSQAFAISSVQNSLDTHTANKTNPHAVTKSQIGLGNVDNTSDTSKPVSSATQTALNLKFDKTGGTLSGSLTVGNGADIHLRAATNSSDSGDLVFEDGAGVEIHRLYAGVGTLAYRYNAGTTYYLWHSGNLPFTVTPSKITIDRDLEVTGNITASKDVVAWFAGAVTSDVLSSLSAVGPLYKPTASSVGIKTNGTQFEVNAANELQIKAGILVPASHTHVISEVTGLQGALDLKINASDLYTWAKAATKPSYNHYEISDAANEAINAGTIRRKVIVSNVKNGQGYISRVAIGLLNPANSFSPAILSVGINDAGTAWTDFSFDGNNGRISSPAGTFALTSEIPTSLPANGGTATYAYRLNYFAGNEIVLGDGYIGGSTLYINYRGGNFGSYRFCNGQGSGLVPLIASDFIVSDNGYSVWHAGNFTPSTKADSTHTHGLTRHSLAPSAYIDSLTASNFRTKLFGSAGYGYNLAPARWQSTVPTPLSAKGMSAYGTMIAWSGDDTQGFIATDYYMSNVVVGGGNADNINWTAKLWHDGNFDPSTKVNTQYNSSLNTDSRNSRGVTRLYRSDDNSDYSVQHYWTGNYWYLKGYSGDTYHAGCQVAFSDLSGLAIRANDYFYLDTNYGASLVGLYDSTRYQGIFAMGNSYKLPLDGQSTGNFYGLAWTHSNVGGEAKAGLSHQLLIMQSGVTYTAIGLGMWTKGNLSIGQGNSGPASSPSCIDTGTSYSDGTTRDKLKIKLYDRYGFTVGSSADVQYHSELYHDFYVANIKVGTFTTSGLDVSNSINKPSLRLRAGSAWDTAIGHDSAGAETMSFIAKNAGTTFKFKTGFDPANFANNTFYPMSNADLEIGNGYCKINGGLVWHSGNDGIGSGLDAEYLAGMHYSSIKKSINTVSNNLGNPSVEEMALIHGQFSNKLRFLPPVSQEESSDGNNWVNSSRASSDALADMMIGEGQQTNILACSAAVGGSSYYRLTWDANQTGYVFLNSLYIYNNTCGLTVNIKIEVYDPIHGWVQLVAGTTNNWPGHCYIPHSTIPFAPNADGNSEHRGKVRVTFSIVNAPNTNGFYIYGIEWFGGYPAGRRNVEYYDRSKNVYFPAGIVAGTSLSGNTLSVSYGITAASATFTSSDTDILKSTTTGQVRIAGGTSASSATGAVIQCFGNDYATAANKGLLKLLAGKGDGVSNFGSISMNTLNNALSNTERFKINGGVAVATASFTSCNVTVSGYITAGGEVTAYSDRRLKTNIQALRVRGDLKPVSYLKDGKQSIGFIAQDVREVYPELVMGDESKEMLSLNYQQLTAVLYAEIMELKNQIKELKGA